MNILNAIMAEVADDMGLNLFSCVVPFCRASSFPTLEAVLAHLMEKHPQTKQLGKYKRQMLKFPVSSTEHIYAKVREFEKRVERKMEETIRKRIGAERNARMMTSTVRPEVVRKPEAQPLATVVVGQKETKLPVAVPTKRKAAAEAIPTANANPKRHKEAKVLDSSISKKKTASGFQGVNGNAKILRPAESSSAQPETVIKTESPPSALNTLLSAEPGTVIKPDGQPPVLNNLVTVGYVPEQKGMFENTRTMNSSKGNAIRPVRLATTTSILFFNVRKNPVDNMIIPNMVEEVEDPLAKLVNNNVVSTCTERKYLAHEQPNNKMPKEEVAEQTALDAEIKAILENTVTRKVTLKLRRVLPIKNEPDSLCPMEQIRKLLRKD